MCLPSKQEEVKKEQFKKDGYSGSNDIWISAPDPDAERVYEGTAAPVATAVRRYYLGNRFAQPKNTSTGPLATPWRKLANQHMTPIGMVGSTGVFGQSPLRSPIDQIRNQPIQRQAFEIVLENGYDDPNIPNLTDPYYIKWAKSQVGNYGGDETFPTVEQLVKAEAEAEAAANKRPTSLGNLMQRSMKTSASRYKDLNVTNRDGVTNYVVRT
jgi:hypothetical protein